MIPKTKGATMSTTPNPNPNNWANPNAAFNISPSAADAFLSALMVDNYIYAVQAQIKPVPTNPGWPAAEPIPIELRANESAQNPNVGYESLSPWFLNHEAVLINTPLQIEVMLTPPAGLAATSQWVNLAQFVADWKANWQATLE